MPELTALLPPEAPPQARPFSPGGFLGQQARGTVYIEEVALPQADEGVQARPKSAVFYATYRWHYCTHVQQVSSSDHVNIAWYTPWYQF